MKPEDSRPDFYRVLRFVYDDGELTESQKRKLDDNVVVTERPVTRELVVGVPWEPLEFLQQACVAAHPFSGEPAMFITMSVICLALCVCMR